MEVSTRGSMDGWMDAWAGEGLGRASHSDRFDGTRTGCHRVTGVACWSCGEHPELELGEGWIRHTAIRPVADRAGDHWPACRRGVMLDSVLPPCGADHYLPGEGRQISFGQSDCAGGGEGRGRLFGGSPGYGVPGADWERVGGGQEVHTWKGRTIQDTLQRAL